MGKILDQFVEIICGDHDNSKQLSDNDKKGIRIHPYAKHITRVCNHMIENLPEDLEGIFILKESYHTYPDRPREFKPLLYFAKEVMDGVLLESLAIPDNYEGNQVTNDNATLRFDYKELLKEEKFGTARFKFHQGHFVTDHRCDFGKGLTFRLTKKLASDRHEVMEMYLDAGESMTPYDTPLIYERIG